MELKKYQKQVIGDLNRYMELLTETKSVSGAYNAFWNEKNIRVGFGGLPYYNDTVNHTPHVCFKVPTGGGKTFLACNSLRVIFDNLPARKAKVVVWLVPSEAILTQTLNALGDVHHDYRKKINADFNGRVMVYSKQQVLDGQQFNPTTVNEQLSIIVMSFDSFRIKNKEGRKVYQENGNLQQFSKFQSTPETLIPDIDETALIQVLNQLSPVVIVDESHHTAGELSVEMLKNLNPSFILDLTATPRKNSNIIAYVDAMQLKSANMVKLPVIVYNRPSQEEVITDALDLRNKLEEEAKKEQEVSGRYNRPIILFQAQPKISENKETFEKLRERLIGYGISKEEIAIKTAAINELKNQNLMSPDCKIRYIITVNALKEGWDCPFAYILATLANKTSVVDVEQILGRVLRLPNTTQNTSKYLNLSYVLTCSADFHSTLQKIIKGLNDAGFSKQDYFAPEQPQDTTIFPPLVQQKLDFDNASNTQQVTEEFLDFSDDAVKTLLEQRATSETNAPLAAMLESAEKKSDEYDNEIKKAEKEFVFGGTPTELKDMQNMFYMYEQYEENALKIEFPQFFIQAPPTLFGDNETKLLEEEDLLETFTLKDKSTQIDFSSVNDTIAKVDIKAKNDAPKYEMLQGAENDFFKAYMESLPPASRIKNCKYIIKETLGKDKFFAGKDLSDYVDRIVENMDGDTLTALEKNVYSYAEKIKKKINALMLDHKREQFKVLIGNGKITCVPKYKLSRYITPAKTFDSLAKSLYTAEGDIGDFEQRILEKVSALPNIVWWHRNLSRTGFCINGFINHYPDFILYTTQRKIVVVETKGKHLITNDDSKDKAELGKTWKMMAGANFCYYMVYEGESSNNPGAVSFDKFIDIVKEL